MLLYISLKKWVSVVHGTSAKFAFTYYICKIQLALLSTLPRSSAELRLMFMEIDIGTIINDYAIFIPSICALVLVVFIVLQLFSIYTDEMNNSF